MQLAGKLSEELAILGTGFLYSYATLGFILEIDVIRQFEVFHFERSPVGRNLIVSGNFSIKFGLILCYLGQGNCHVPQPCKRAHGHALPTTKEDCLRFALPPCLAPLDDRCR